jgi:hypothetical protein
MHPWKRWSIAAATTLLGAAYLHWKGPVPVVRVFDTLPFDAPGWYMLSAFPVLGLLAADGLDLATNRRWRHGLELAVQLGLMVFLSAARLELRIPISGHALLFAAFLLRRAWLREPWVPWRRLELALGVGLLAMVAGVKLLWWRDPVTLGVGVVVAVILTWIGRATLRDREPGPSGR